MKFASVFVVLAAAVASAEVTPGELLMAEMNCAACHGPSDELRMRLASRPAPLVGAYGVNASPEWLRDFLLDPQKTKPGTLMPDMLHALPPEKRAEAAESLTHFLVSIQGPSKPAGEGAGAKSGEGKALYHAVGCVQCHAPTFAPAGKEEELAALVASSVPLAGLRIAKKYSTGELAAFLADPLRSRPSGRMPSLNLSGSEAASIAEFLLREQETKNQPAFAVDPLKVTDGAQYFSSLQCVNCHGGTAISKPEPAARSLAELRVRQPGGCLAVKPSGRAPKFELTDRQRVVILAGLRGLDVLALPLTGAQQIRRTMTALNCYACHSRERRGGITGLHREYLTNDEGPPSLNEIGVKIPVTRIREALTKGKKTRDSMPLRMPVFGKGNIDHLPSLFEATDNASVGKP